VIDSALLINTLVGTQGKYTTDEVSDFLKDLIVARLADLLGTAGIGLLDLPAKYDEIASGTRAKVTEEFGKYGLELVDFFINAVTPPEEVQKAIDARSAMGAVGDLNAFMKFQAANSMSKLAEQGGGAGGGMGAGAMGMGMGAGFGMMMPGMIQQAMAQPAQPAAAPPRPAAPRPAGAKAGPDFSELAPVTSDPKAMIRSVAEAAGYQVAAAGDGLEITVPVGPLRKQRVRVEFGTTDTEGHAMVRYWSICGRFDPRNAQALLRYNTSMLHGAFAVKEVSGNEMVVLQANQLGETIDPLEVSRVLAAIAWQADQVEQKLGGGDEN
jgi:hypothetical protein